MENKPESQRRPTPRTMVSYDPNNLYTRLGVSPLASTEEIKAIATKRRFEVKDKRDQSAQNKRTNEEIMKWDNIADKIGAENQRREYDNQHPQNVILTIQPGEEAKIVHSLDRLCLITVWLLETLGVDTLLPSPNAFPLWVPNPIDERLLQRLKTFIDNEESDSVPTL